MGQSDFVRLDNETVINRHDVSSLEWDRRFYMNGSASWLVVTMNDGRKYRIESTQYTDCYKIEKEILSA